MKPTAQIIRLTFLGGAIGTLVRFALFFSFGDLPSVIFVNLAGAALIGWLNGNKKYESPEQNALWKTGFAGGFTTMSGFASLAVLYAQGIGWVAVVATILVTALGLAAYWFSFRISRGRSRA